MVTRKLRTFSGLAACVVIGLTPSPGFGVDKGLTSRLGGVCDLANETDQPGCEPLCRRIEKAGKLKAAIVGTDYVDHCKDFLRAKEATAFKSDRACNPKLCIYRLKQTINLTGHEQFKGQGFILDIRANSDQRSANYTITDRSGGRTVFLRRTSGVSYVSGPLRKAKMDWTSGGFILTVPR